MELWRTTGLGLYIVQQIALAHGGWCRVTSTAEEGTTFTIAWPRYPIEDTPMRREDPPTRRGVASRP
jgi:signal transduction histidine kinase